MDDFDVPASLKHVTDELGSFGISCTEAQTRLLLKHLHLVIEKNKVMNLTRITDPSEAVTLHIVDSLLPLACPACGLSRSDRFLDMGTGAGFPGIPLGIMTGAHGMLVDSVSKKVTAVEEFLGTLGLTSLHARHARLEELAVSLGSSQDYVFARAVAQSNVLVEYATPFLKMNGFLVLEKGNPTEGECDAALRAADLCGLSLVSREGFELPHGLGHREIFFYQKVASPRIHLPRKNGMARRDPLGI